MAGLADRISVKKLTYPRAIDRLQEVREWCWLILLAIPARR